MTLPELLSPAGDIEKAYYAFRYGADAIYLGVPMFSLRTRMNYITEKDIEEIISFAHKNKKKVYVTVNSFPHQHMINVLKKHLKFIKKVKPDGVIIADAGVLSLSNEIIPDIPKHLSVQTTTVNTAAMQFWKNNGVKRIIMAREISLKEAKMIRKLMPEIELEMFVHGAMCISYSGRCLLSTYLTARDPNRGECSHSCRWNYRVYNEKGNEIPNNFTSSDNIFHIPCDDKNNNKKIQKKSCINEDLHNYEHNLYLEEELRQNEFIPIEEDFHGTHIMSSRDMCMIEHLKEIVDLKLNSLKIEGRNKTLYYLSTVIRAYRKALNDVKDGKQFDKSLWKEIHATANRGFFAGFLKGKPNIEGQQYESNTSSSTHEFIGIVLEWENNKLRFDIKNRINEGDEIEFVFPDIKDDFKIKAKGLIKDGKKVKSMHGGNGDGWLDCNKKVNSGIIIRKI